MTALEQQLTKALRALSAQYEQAQQQHAAQVETLSKPWSGMSRSSAGKRHTWPGTTGRSPRRCAGARPDAPAGARAGSWSEPLMVRGSGVGRRRRCGDQPSGRAGETEGGRAPHPVQRP